MVGPALLVATGSSSRDIYLPLARWYDYWTGRVIGGGRSVHFDEAEGPAPIYVRGSSIIPTAEAGTSNLVFPMPGMRLQRARSAPKAARAVVCGLTEPRTAWRSP